MQLSDVMNKNKVENILFCFTYERRKANMNEGECACKQELKGNVRQACLVSMLGMIGPHHARASHWINQAPKCQIDIFGNLILYQ